MKIAPSRTPAILAVSLLSLALLAGCATQPAATDKEAMAEYEQANDPGEPTNRAIFQFNQGFDKGVLKPITKGYRAAVPDPLRDRIRDFLANLREPWTFVNDVLQFEFGRAGITLGRFCVNSTMGMLGIIDLATAAGLEGHTEDFGQTLAVWGVGEGPFVTLPFFGPSNPRDTVGLIVDTLADPFGMWLGGWVPDEAMWAKTGVSAVDKREKYLDPLDEIERTSLDYYASLRSLYRQRRAEEVRNGQKAKSLPAPGMTFDFDAPADDKPAAAGPSVSLR
jgi:phospholipid-binding lipoprotein MlaA